MLKCLLLAKWFGLSDPQLEECLQDRLSFRRFAGLTLHDATPDETTLVRVRGRLREANLDRRIFDGTRAAIWELLVHYKGGEPENLPGAEEF
jgi:IS5 family transposase